jgi:hypothetical protein
VQPKSYVVLPEGFPRDTSSFTIEMTFRLTHLTGLRHALLRVGGRGSLLVTQRMLDSWQSI